MRTLAIVLIALACAAPAADADIFTIDFTVAVPTFMPYTEDDFTFTSLSTGTLVVDEGTTTVIVLPVPPDGDAPGDTEFLMETSTGIASASVAITSSKHISATDGIDLISIDVEFIAPGDEVTFVGFELDGVTVKAVVVLTSSDSGGIFSFVSDPGDWTELGLVTITTDIDNVGTVAFDDLVLTPEPSSWALGLLGLLAFGIARRRAA